MEEQQSILRDQSISAEDASAAGLLEVGIGCAIRSSVRFVPQDRLGVLRRVVLEAECTLGEHVVVHGGVRVGAGARVEDNVILGQPEYGYAVHQHYPGAGAPTAIGAGAIVRAGAIIYAGARIGELAHVGHHTLLRSHVVVGDDTQLAHRIVVERGARIGRHVRMSPASHITADTRVGDHVFFGAGVLTVNSKHLDWRREDVGADLRPPRFGERAKVGAGSTILAGVVIGADALIGAGSVVTRDIPPGTVAYGVPARVRSTRISSIRPDDEHDTGQVAS